VCEIRDALSGLLSGAPRRNGRNCGRSACARLCAVYGSLLGTTDAAVNCCRPTGAPRSPPVRCAAEPDVVMSATVTQLVLRVYANDVGTV